jgi:tripartite-type tricarboxylate transporter receptor subunit TctC
LVADKEFSDRLVSMGYQPIGDTIPEMKAAIQSDRAKWKKVIDATGIKAE